MSAEMTAKKGKVERRLTSGNLWTMAVLVAGLISDAGYQHFTPSMAAEHASQASDAAFQKAAEAATKSAVTELTVATHTQQINQIGISVDTLRMDMAVVKSQGDDAKASAKETSDKLDRVLAAVYRMQGQSGRQTPPQ